MDHIEDERDERSQKGKLNSSGIINGVLIFTVAISLFLMFIGGIFMFLEDPLNTQADEQSDRETSAWLDFSGKIVFWLGASILSGILIVGAVLMGDMDPAVRFGMLFLAGLMLIGTGLAI